MEFNIQKYLKENFIYTKTTNPKDISDPITQSVEKTGKETIKALKENIDSSKAVAKIQLGQGIELSLPISTEIKGEKGDKGDKGEKGDTPDEEEIIKSVLKKIPVPKDGKTPDEKKIVAQVLKVIKKPENGKDAVIDYDFIVREAVRFFEEQMPEKPLTEFEIKEIVRESTPKPGVDFFTKKDRKSIVSEVKKSIGNIQPTSYSLFQRETTMGSIADVNLSAPTNGQSLTYQASTGKWVNSTVSGGSGTPGGSDTQVQFNDGGSFGGDAGLTYNKTTDVLTTTGGLIDSSLTASEIVITNGSKKLVSAAVATYPSLTELTYLKGVTSAVQTQIDNKQPLDADLTSWAAITRAAGFDTFVTTPSSANLASLITDETGSGALVFATSPGFTTAANPVSNDGASLGISGTAWSDLFLASGGVINWNAGNFTMTHSAGLLTMNGGLTTTVANTANTAGLSITQNDTTNNPKGISVTNAGTGNGIYIDANGNTGTTASSSGALFLDNTDNTGTGANFYTNGATVGTTGVVFAKVDNAAASGPVMRIDNDGTGSAIVINANGNVGTGDTTSGALRIINTNNTGYGVNVYSNAGASSGALVRIHADNASFDQPALHIVNDGTSGSAASIRLDGVSPQIEFVEDDQASPAGKYEIQVQGDVFYLNSRNSGDTAFEGIVRFNRLASGGAFSPVTNDTVPLGTSSLMFSDLFLASGGVINWNNGNATLTHSAGLLTSNVPISLGTSNAITVGTIELGHASDTTLSRSAAGVLAVEGIVIPSISSTNTLTNKRVTRRLVTTNAPGATPTTNTDNVDVMNFTGLATAITSMTTNLSGTPIDGDLLEFRFTDDGTARGITWGASFAATTVALPTTTVISTMLRVGFEYSGSTWKCIATC